MAAVLLTALPAMADQKPPKPKNKKELEALQGWQAAEQSGDPDKELAAITNVLENFADTEFKPLLLSDGMRAAEQKNDMGLVLTWTQLALKDDPNNIEARVVMAAATARHTRENDLDKADSLKTIQTNANQALTMLKTANAPAPGMTDQQWTRMKMQLTEEAYEALGIAATVDKRFPDAVTNFEAGVAADPTSSVMKARLSEAYVKTRQYDKAIATADQVLADPNAVPVVKQLAQNQKDIATRMKAPH
jgi:tetratricopeptide (TPR) repeat protein